jgi:hypothetical protein
MGRQPRWSAQEQNKADNALMTQVTPQTQQSWQQRGEQHGAI